MDGSDTGSRKKQRVCILGAGPAGLAAAYGLSASEDLRERYDVTIYQVGWRAGGKCSTGRSGEEMALQQNCAHYLFGCYTNTFKMMREVYRELPATGRHEFGSFDKVLLPRNLVALKELFKGEWHTWFMEFPTNGAVPGEEQQETLDLKYIVEMLLEWLLEGIFGWKFISKINNLEFSDKQELPPAWEPHSHWVKRLLHKLSGCLLRGVLGLSRHRHGRDWVDSVLVVALKLLRGFFWLLEKGSVEDHLGARRRWSMIDYNLSLIIGMLDDQVLQPGGYESIDHYDYREWLGKHGASKYATDSPFVKLWYENSLAYHGGDTGFPAMSAGIALLGQLYASGNYRGSVAYSLQHEIGDSFIAPLCIALRGRGVKINYFHKFKHLQPSSDGRQIQTITIEQQVKLVNGEADGYDPFVRVKDWPCWPNQPLSEQFCEDDRKRFEQGDYDLESFYSDWHSSHPDLELEFGRDFDKVIFAVPHGVIPFYCPEIYQSNLVWRRLVDENPAVESQSYRVWFKTDLREIGWPWPRPIMSAYQLPYCTWEDDGQLASVEKWPQGREPGAIACVFGPLQAPVFAPGPEDHDYIPGQLAVVEQQSSEFASCYASGIWPKVGSPENPEGIDPEKVLMAVERANSGPLERYTMTWPGALASRPRVTDSGYDNLLFAGDWTRNGVEAGSIEGATMSGFEASRAICGFPKVIFGENISYQ